MEDQGVWLRILEAAIVENETHISRSRNLERKYHDNAIIVFSVREHSLLHRSCAHVYRLLR